MNARGSRGGPDKSFIFMCLLLGAGLVWLLVFGPLHTNDGPMHIAFARAMAEGILRGSLQDYFYTLHFNFEPNVGVYYIGAALLQVMSPAAAESVIQWLALLGPGTAGYLALRQIDRRSAWLAVPLVTMLINRQFFWGLYNSCLSIAGFLVTVGLVVHALRAPRLRHGPALFIVLLITFLCHAGGFVMAVIAAGALVLADGIRRLRTNGNIAALMPLLPLAVGLIAGAALQIVPMLAHAGEPMEYGVALKARIGFIRKMEMLAMNGIPVLLTTAYFLLLAGAAAWGLWSSRKASDPTGVRWHLALAGAFILLTALIIPDVAGGGWTHFRRSALYPELMLILLLAALPLGALLQRAILLVSSSILAVQLGTLVLVHNDLTRDQQGFLEAERLIGRSCTVLPLMLKPKDRLWEEPNELHTIRIARLSHEATRYEMSKDRVALYSWLARLSVYPVQYRPERNPHEHLFHWTPRNLRPGITPAIDIAGFERQADTTVDYVLIRALPYDINGPTRAPLRAHLTANYQPIYRSQDGLIALYRRNSVAPRCTPS